MKTLKGDPICYLCGIMIDAQMVDPTHPLFGTIDHVQPLSLGGSKKGKWNRLPAHRICNSVKGSDRPSNKLMQVCLEALSAVPESKRLIDGMTKAKRKKVAQLRRLAANAIFKADGYPL